MSHTLEPRLSARLAAMVLSIPLRLKIIIPYLLVIVLLVAGAIWFMNQSFERRLQEQFHGQLSENVAAANQTVSVVESGQLAQLHSVTQIAGLAQAVESHNWEAVDALVRPLTVNADLRLVHIVDQRGMPVYGLRTMPDGFAENENAPFLTWSPVIEVLKGRSDAFVGVVEAPWGSVLYTAGPIKLDNDLVGVILVGSPLTELLTTLQNGIGATVTIYRPTGQVVLSSLTGSQTLSNLDSAMVQTLKQASPGQSPVRPVNINATTGDEALGALILRGQATDWVLGVARPRIESNDQLALAELLGWFTLLAVVLVGLGLIVAQLIALPIVNMTAVMTEVGQGNLKAKMKDPASDEIGTLAQRFNWMVRELSQREMMREMFGQVVAPEVREALHTGKVKLGGELKVVTVLFTDIRDFTALAEKYNPTEVVTLLNNYFEVVSAAIHKSGGFINTFGGDSTMAVFGVPLTTEPRQSAYQALQAAFAIRTHLAEFNARQIENKQLPIRFGIGISTGEAVTGNIGSQDRYAYTVIGDTVNTAARVQSLSTRFVDSNILITEDTRQALGKDAQLLVIDHGDVALKGKQKLVRVYGVMGMRFAKAEPVFQVGGIPRRDVLEALYLYCKGFNHRIIGQTKNVDPLVVHQWIEGAARLYERSCEELRQEFALTEGELRRLNNGTRSAADPQPVAETSGSNGRTQNS